MYTSVDALIHHRKELTLTTGAFAKSAAMLGNCEEHTSLSCALSQLAETEEKIEQLYSKQVDNDFFYLAELLKDYIALIGAVKEAFHQRVKVFQVWQHSQQMLTKKREIKAKLELALKTDKISQANEEVIEVCNSTYVHIYCFLLSSIVTLNSIDIKQLIQLYRFHSGSRR